MIYNDSNRSLYLKFGTTASATDFTVLLVAGAYYEVPFGFTGRLDGIWVAANGFARLTELTS
jgi:pyruvate dehydrogenase complex dehydrogenase (E1) component